MYDLIRIFLVVMKEKEQVQQDLQQLEGEVINEENTAAEIRQQLAEHKKVQQELEEQIRIQSKQEEDLQEEIVQQQQQLTLQNNVQIRWNHNAEISECDSIDQYPATATNKT